MADCFILTCRECRGYSFTKAGERFATTRVCRRCEQGWTGQGASTPSGPKTSLKPKPKLKPHPKHEPKPQAVTGPSNPHGVAPGQIWESLDPRDQGRRIRVLEVEEQYALVLSAGTRRRRVKLTGFTRLKGRGYRLVPGD